MEPKIFKKMVFGDCNFSIPECTTPCCNPTEDPVSNAKLFFENDQAYSLFYVSGSVGCIPIFGHPVITGSQPENPVLRDYRGRWVEMGGEHWGDKKGYSRGTVG